MKQFLLAASLLTFIGSQASAGYFDNRGDWKDMPRWEQIGFVQGVLSQALQRFQNDSAEVLAEKEEIARCVLDEDFSASDLVDIVDGHYTNLENWTNPPHVALSLGVGKVCRY